MTAAHMNYRVSKLTSVYKQASLCEFCRSQSKDNMIFLYIYLYRSNLTFSGVLRGTQGGHVERCVNLKHINAKC